MTVPNDREGILQDVHWSGGMIGYFPSYALGSAYGVQMLAAMEKDFDPWADVEKGDLSRIPAWLGDKIHRHGKLLHPPEGHDVFHRLSLAGMIPFYHAFAINA